jgi:hypothetical protein
MSKLGKLVDFFFGSENENKPNNEISHPYNVTHVSHVERVNGQYLGIPTEWQNYFKQLNIK